MMNCLYGMVDRRKAFSLTSSRYHCQRSSTSRISDTSKTGFEFRWMKLRSSDNDNHYTTAPRCKRYITFKSNATRRILRNKVPLLHRFTKFFAHIPANICLDEDVLKTSWRCLLSSSSEEVFKTSSRRLDGDEYVRLSLTSSEDILVKTNIFALAIRLEDVFKTFSRRLEDVFKTSWRPPQDVFKTSSRRLEKTSSRHFQGVSSS